MTNYPHITKVEKSMKWCRDYLDKRGDAKTLEQLFVRLLIIDLISAYDKTIYDAVVQRVKESCDSEFAEYVEALREMHGRPFGTSTRVLISTYNNMYSDEFESILYKEKKAVYDNLVKLRNTAAHGGSINIRLSALMRMHDDAKIVPRLFATMLRYNHQG